MSEPTFTSSLAYRDPKAALDWLTKAFGFEITMLIESPDGNVNMMHAEMSFAGKGRIMLGGEWTDRAKSPASIGGVNTQRLHVSVDENLDGHCERARAAGATIFMEPEDQFYGERCYIALDLEGHPWTFSMPVRAVSRAEAEKASGLKIESTTWA